MPVTKNPGNFSEFTPLTPARRPWSVHAPDTVHVGDLVRS